MRMPQMKIVEIREMSTTVRQLCEIIPIDIVAHDRALELLERHRLSIFDALIVSAAIGAGCTTFGARIYITGRRSNG